MIFEKDKIDTSEYTFIIDGNYLAMRIAFAVGLDFKSDPKKHAAEYMKALCQSTSNLIKEYRDSISKVIMVIDGRSWRKDVDMIVPQLKQHLPVEDMQYKANRNKDEAEIDLKVVMATFRSFVDLLDEKFNIPLIEGEGAEGDDLLYVVSSEEVKRGNKCLLYTSDGDISQLITDDILVLKQMPADRPNKIIISESRMTQLYPESDTPSEDSGEMFIFGNTKGTTVSDILLRKFKQEDTMSLNAAMFLLLKSVSGDKKDNIHPTFLWKNTDKNGDVKEFKPTTMFLKKGLKVMGMTAEDLTIEMLYDRFFISELLYHTLLSTSIYPKLPDVTRVYKSNLKILLADEDSKDLLPLDLVRLSICGGGENELPACLEIFDGNSERHTPTREFTDSIFKELYGDTKLTLKDIKALKFTKPLMVEVLKKLPPMRDCILMSNIYHQNLEMLHLNEKSIPKKVIESSLESYNLKKDIVCDMDIVTDFRLLLLSGSPSSDNIFNGLGLDEHIKTTSSGEGSGSTKQVDLDSDDIMNTVFGAFGGM